MTQNLFDLRQEVVVITGATGVLGESITQSLAHAGAIIVLIARNQDKINKLVADLQQRGTVAMGISADVLDKNALTNAARQVLNAYGRVDILVNGAGGNRAEATAIPGERNFFDLPEDALRWVFDLNLLGTILPTQVFGAIMAEQKAGVILNISSMASFQPLTRVVAYSAAKAALNNFTQWLATYMATEHDSNIRVNAIAPGFFLGQQNRFLLMNEDDTLTQRGQLIIDHTPVGRFGQPEDLTGTVLWLVSNASRFVTGIVVPVDGGFSAFSGI